jgi:hypothetical protein
MISDPQTAGTALISLEPLAVAVLARLKEHLNAEIALVNQERAPDDAILAGIDPSYIPAMAEPIQTWKVHWQPVILWQDEDGFPIVRVRATSQKEDEPEKPWDTANNRFTYYLGPQVEVTVWVKHENPESCAMQLFRTLEAVGRVLVAYPVTVDGASGRLIRQNTVPAEAKRASSETRRADQTLYIQEATITYLYRWWMAETATRVERKLYVRDNVFGEPVYSWYEIAENVPCQIIPELDVRMVDPYRRYVSSREILYAETDVDVKNGDRFVVGGKDYYVQASMQPNRLDTLKQFAVQDVADWPEEGFVALRPVAYSGGDYERGIPATPVYSAEAKMGVFIRQSLRDTADRGRNIPTQDLTLSVREEEAVLRPQDLVVWSGAQGANLWQVTEYFEPIHMGFTTVRNVTIQQRYVP